MLDKIKKTAEFLNSKINSKLDILVILGSGLGSFVEKIENQKVIDYSQIPNFPVSTVEGHDGKLVFGTISGKNIVAMKGRFHYYEGYDMKQISFPIRVFKALGINILMVSNAVGGLNPEYKQGDLMLITDHINFFSTNPLIGKNNPELGERFPDMSKVYDENLINKAEKIAKKLQIKIRKGIYIGSGGPTLETPAEYKMFRILGADVTGMSTVPEIIAANHAGMRCFGMSIITNEATPKPYEQQEETTHEEVQQVAGNSEPKMTAIFEELISQI